MTALLDHLRRTMATTAFRLAAASAAGFLHRGRDHRRHPVLADEQDPDRARDLGAEIRGVRASRVRPAATASRRSPTRSARAAGRKGRDLYFLADADGSEDRRQSQSPAARDHRQPAGRRLPLRERARRAGRSRASAWRCRSKLARARRSSSAGTSKRSFDMRRASSAYSSGATASCRSRPSLRVSLSGGRS